MVRLQMSVDLQVVDLRGDSTAACGRVLICGLFYSRL